MHRLPYPPTFSVPRSGRIVYPIGDYCSPEQQRLNDLALEASYRQTCEAVDEQQVDDRLDHMARALCWSLKINCHVTACAHTQRCLADRHDPNLLTEAKAAIAAADEWKENT